MMERRPFQSNFDSVFHRVSSNSSLNTTLPSTTDKLYGWLIVNARTKYVYNTIWRCKTVERMTRWKTSSLKTQWIFTVLTKIVPRTFFWTHAVQRTFFWTYTVQRTFLWIFTVLRKIVPKTFFWTDTVYRTFLWICTVLKILTVSRRLFWEHSSGLTLYKEHSCESALY